MMVILGLWHILKLPYRINCGKCLKLLINLWLTCNLDCKASFLNCENLQFLNKFDIRLFVYEIRLIVLS